MVAKTLTTPLETSGLAGRGDGQASPTSLNLPKAGVIMLWDQSAGLFRAEKPAFGYHLQTLRGWRFAGRRVD